MKFLLDTDTCSAYMRRASVLSHRLIQFGEESIATSTLTLAELYSGAFQRPNARKILAQIDHLRTEIAVLPFDTECAEAYGKANGALLKRGIVVPTIDLMIASVAMTHDLAGC